MILNDFIHLSTAKIQELISDKGPKVCVCPVNGTRRWFTLEHANTDYEDIEAGYLDTAAKGYVELFKLFFEHGIQILLVPSFGPDLLTRGEEYTQMAVEGFSRLTNHPVFLDFYRESNIEVRFYGDYKKYFDGTPFAYLTEQLDQLTQQTAGEGKQTLYFGIFGNDATEQVAQISVAYYQVYHRVPTREEIISAYYGKPLPPVEIFIGFDKFSAFDMPLIATGMEDLYFTVSPTLYMTQTQFRTILYDHLYARQSEEDYNQLSEQTWKQMRQFYSKYREYTLGVGSKRSGIWYPNLLEAS